MIEATGIAVQLLQHICMGPKGSLVALVHYQFEMKIEARDGCIKSHLDGLKKRS